jgi:hypothetical protein
MLFVARFAHVIRSHSLSAELRARFARMFRCLERSAARFALTCRCLEARFARRLNDYLGNHVAVALAGCRRTPIAGRGVAAEQHRL